FVALGCLIWILLTAGIGLHRLETLATPVYAAVALSASTTRYLARIRLPTPSEDSPWWHRVLDVDLLGAVVTGTWAIAVTAAGAERLDAVIPTEGAGAWAFAALVRYAAKWQAVTKPAEERS